MREYEIERAEREKIKRKKAIDKNRRRNIKKQTN